LVDRLIDIGGENKAVADDLVQGTALDGDMVDQHESNKAIVLDILQETGA
jgi:hypothetical protein